ncbi:MAG TPA: hypothetical protein VIU62_17125, partial [Chloroflexota bacterium]
MKSYVLHETYRLYKLHGSTNWEREVYGAELSPIGAAERLRYTDSYALRGAAEPGSIKGATIPAIAVPTMTKKNFECPEFHLTSLDDNLYQITKLLVIGWRGMEEHFLSRCRDVRRKAREAGKLRELRDLMVVDRTPQDAADVVDRLAA